MADKVLEAARQEAIEIINKPQSRGGTPGDPFMQPPPRSVMGLRGGPGLGLTSRGQQVLHETNEDDDAIGRALVAKGSLGDMLEILRKKREQEEARGKAAAKATGKRKQLREKRLGSKRSTTAA